MKRNKHSLSHYKLLTCDMGRLYPIANYEVLPGDSIQQQTALLLRCSPLMAPVMHPISVRVHHWFVPYRIIWDGWEDFITGVNEAGYPAQPLATPQAEGSLLDYLGVPTGRAGIDISFLPVFAYNMIWNEFYRDQDLQTEVASSQGSPLHVAWEKDYFSAARPWAQKGGDVSLPLGLDAPVVPLTSSSPVEFTNGVENRVLASGIGAAAPYVNWSPGGTTVASTMFWKTTGLKADLTNATAANINELRRAFALQRYQEARALYGSRYTEYLRYLGVQSSDARLQRPEYLGGGKATISFSEVLKTGSGEDPAEPIGTLKGHGISAMRSRRYRRFFEEHGVVLSLLSVRPRTMYMDGLHRQWSRRTKEDYWQRELEHIGQQEVYSREVYGEGTPGGDAIFGYQDRYSEYRHHPSTVAGEFRSTLSYWHLARAFANAPTLNGDFVECDPGKRIFAEQTKHSLWVMASHSIQARRMVSNNAVGRIV